MKDFFSKVVSGEFGFDSLKESIIRFNEAVFTHQDMTFLSDFYNSAAGVMPYVTIAVMFLFLFFGKKLLPQIKFVCSFLVGFGLGVYFLAPTVDGIISGIPAWVSGLVIALLLLAINRLFYFLFFIFATFFAVSLLLNSFLNLGTSILIFAAVIGVIIALIFKKYVEMCGTAFLGAFIMLKEVNSSLFAFNTEINLGTAFSIELVSLIAIIIAVIGFIVQIKTRKRY